jgi:hypothetical protein
MLKLNAGLSRKVGEPNYGSRGASVNLELEVESGLVNDPDGLLDRIRKLFTLARQAVDLELRSNQATTTSPNNSASPSRNGNGRARAATASQLRAIRAIADQLQLEPEPERLAQDAAGVDLAELSLQQASQLIDDLKTRNGNGSRR